MVARIIILTTKQIGNDRKATAYFQQLNKNLKGRYKLDRDIIEQ